MKTVVVVGGGITGLSTLHYLARQMKGQEVRYVLVEKEATLGGKMATHYEDDFVMELGADSIVARHRSVAPLIEELQLQDRVVYNNTGVSYIYRHNELHAIPLESMYGIPMNLEALQQSTLVSEEGKQAALRDFTLLNEKFTAESSVGEFLEYFLGKEMVTNQIAPVLSGIYSGDLYKLTLASTVPYLVEYKNKYGSIIKGFEANKAQYVNRSNNKFLSFKNGLRELFDRFEETLEHVTFLKQTVVTDIEELGQQAIVTLDNGERIEADIVVLATPANTAQQLIKDEHVTSVLEQFKTSSIMTVYLGYDIQNDALPAEGTGFIVSDSDSVSCDACTWTSAKWPNTSAKGKLLLRVFYKKTNPKFEQILRLTDEELTQLAIEDVATSLNIQDAPTTVTVAKWPNQMPVYHLGHSKLVTQLEEAMEIAHPSILLAGCSYYGVGIGLCIENGKTVAERITKKISND